MATTNPRMTGLPAAAYLGTYASVSALQSAAPAASNAGATALVNGEPFVSDGYGWNYVSRSRSFSTMPTLTAFIGDSITNDTTSGTLGPQEYHTHAVELAGGKMVWAGKYGQQGMGLLTPGNSGQTWAQTLAQVAAASPRPQRVCLLIGINDFGSGNKTFAQVKPAYIQAVQDLAALGCEVVVSQLTPLTSASATVRLRIHTFNTWVTRWATLNGYRCQRFYSACVDRAGTGDWASGLSRDATHPNFAGARVMGQVCVNTCATDYASIPYLVADNGDLTGLANGLMLTDVITDGSSAQTAGDGIPDQWGTAGNKGDYTYTLTSAGADAIGNWFRIQRTVNDYGPVFRTQKIAASVGDVIQLGFRLKTTVSSTGAGMSMQMNGSSGTSWVSSSNGGLLNPVTQTITGQQYSVDMLFSAEAVCTVAGTAGVYADFTTVQAGGAGGDFRLGQFTMRNLTALGII